MFPLLPGSGSERAGSFSTDQGDFVLAGPGGTQAGSAFPLLPGSGTGCEEGWAVPLAALSPALPRGTLYTPLPTTALKGLFQCWTAVMLNQSCTWLRGCLGAG